MIYAKRLSPLITPKSQGNALTAHPGTSSHFSE